MDLDRLHKLPANTREELDQISAGILGVAGHLSVEHAQSMSQLLNMADEELVRYGNPPCAVEASFTDGQGNVYVGILHLVEQEGGRDHA